MNANQLYRLGRCLLVIARAGMTDPHDLLDHPSSALREIAVRTAFAQSYVSATVARLREKGWVETTSDPSDRRRTLVRLSDQMIRAIAEREARPLDAALRAALPDLSGPQRAECLALLDALLRLLPDEAAYRHPATQHAGRGTGHEGGRE